MKLSEFKKSANEELILEVVKKRQEKMAEWEIAQEEWEEEENEENAQNMYEKILVIEKEFNILKKEEDKINKKLGRTPENAWKEEIKNMKESL